MATQQEAKREAEFWDRKGAYIESKMKKRGINVSKGWQKFNEEMMKRIDTAASLGAENRKKEVEKIYSEGAREMQANFDYDRGKAGKSYIIGKKHD